MSVRTREEIGREIARLREQNSQQSQRSLAEAVGMEQSAVAKVETGKRSLTVIELALISEHFGVPAESILQGEGDALVAMRANGDDPELTEGLELVERHLESILTARAFVGGR
jgi:transcriptional regulator with XRE-family HTH domain